MSQWYAAATLAFTHLVIYWNVYHCGNRKQSFHVGTHATPKNDKGSYIKSLVENFAILDNSRFRLVYKFLVSPFVYHNCQAPQFEISLVFRCEL